MRGRGEVCDTGGATGRWWWPPRVSGTVGSGTRQGEAVSEDGELLKGASTVAPAPGLNGAGDGMH